MHTSVVKEAEKLSNAAEEFSKKESFEAPEKKEAPSTNLTKKEINNPDVHKITPTRRIKSMIKPNPKWEKQRQHDKEYVMGMLENKASPGVAAHFWKNNWPGDDYEEWTIPDSIPVAIPRHVANHLHNKCKYHNFKYRSKAPHEVGVDDFDSKFEVIETKNRFDFQPLGAFA